MLLIVIDGVDIGKDVVIKLEVINDVDKGVVVLLVSINCVVDSHPFVLKPLIDILTWIGGFLSVVLIITISIFDIIFDSEITTFGNITILFWLDVSFNTFMILFELSYIFMI